MTLSVPRAVIVVAATLALFAGLAALRWLLSPVERGEVDVQGAYRELARALESAELLPFDTEAAAREAIEAVVQDPAQVVTRHSSERGDGSVRVPEVIVARTRKGLVVELDVYPQQWREYAAGPLQDALRKLALVPLERQAAPVGAGGTAGRRNFSFSVSVGVHGYECTPFFDGERCSQIMLTGGAG